MSKSATDERVWGYHGPMTLGPPPDLEQIKASVQAGCGCYACRVNREYIGQHDVAKLLLGPSASEDQELLERLLASAEQVEE